METRAREERIMILFAIILASVIESAVSFGASFAVIISEKRVRRFVHWVIGFAIGVLLGVVFFDLLPETFEMIGVEYALPLVLGGFLLFFALEMFISWFHWHGDEDRPHVTGYLVLFGDAVHNFIDGVIIALAFLTDISVGVGASLAVVMHEIPQEVSDFAIMLHSGFSKWRAMMYNVLVSLTTILGALLGYWFASGENIVGVLLAIVAGNFLYLAAADLIPELHHSHKSSSALAQIALILFGIALIYALTLAMP